MFTASQQSIQIRGAGRQGHAGGCGQQFLKKTLTGHHGVPHVMTLTASVAQVLQMACKRH
jgi:hypothetical protein